MRRRCFVVGAAGGLAGALAGCLGSGDGTVERPPENRVEDGIMTAVGEANAAALAVQAAREDADGPAELSVDVEPLEERLATARDALDDAESAPAADGYVDAIAAARDYVEAVAGLVTAAGAFASAGEDLLELEVALADGHYDAAADLLADLEPSVEDARTAASDARSTLAGIDGVRVDRYGARLEELATGLETAASLATAADALVVGYQSVLEGRDALQRGRNEFETGNYGAAAEECSTASDRFAAATAEFESAASETGTALDGRLDVALCRSTNLEDAAGHFEAAASAADGNDLLTANEEYQTGDDALDAAAAC